MSGDFQSLGSSDPELTFVNGRFIPLLKVLIAITVALDSWAVMLLFACSIKLK